MDNQALLQDRPNTPRPEVAQAAESPDTKNVAGEVKVSVRNLNFFYGQQQALMRDLAFGNVERDADKNRTVGFGESLEMHLDGIA